MQDKEVILAVDSLTKTFVKDGEPLYALNNVSFELGKGEILGIIGRNGSGKSTLLKVLSKITGPSSGSIEYEGVLTSIIEIGTGFHPDLTGRENVQMSGQLLGLSSSFMAETHDKIVDYSGLEDFMDMPVKHYSSGMYLRLAFAIAFNSQIDILLLDEVLAVGDADFRRKCKDKIRELKDEGASVLLVSHQMEPILEFCERCMWLDNGEIVSIGPSMEVIEDYLKSSELDSGKIRGERSEIIEENQINFSALDNLYVRVTSLDIRAKGKMEGEDILMEDVVEIALTCEKLVEEDSIEFIFTLSNFNSIRVLTDSYALREVYTPQLVSKGKYEVVCEIPAQLLNRGVYDLDVMISKNASQSIVEARQLGRFKILSNKKMAFDVQISTVVKPQLKWDVKRLAE